jgi:hypothetical protein
MTAQFDAPDLAPVIAAENTPTGWRGLTEDGELLNVTARVNGSPIVIPESLSVMRDGEVIGYRRIETNNRNIGNIGEYEGHLGHSNEFVRANKPLWALSEIDAALGCVQTTVARYNRAMILLSLGRWQEGFDEWAHCERTSPLFMRTQYRAALEHGLIPWQGENIAGKTLLLIHDHGYGDSILALRYVKRLQAMGAEVMLQVPRELERLAAQFAPVTREFADADYVCSLLLLLQLFAATPETISSAPYLKVDPKLADKWRNRLDGKRKIGVAWSVRTNHEDDYPRPCPLEQFVKALGNNLVSVQQQGAVEAYALGVVSFRFDDFADCAALMSVLDEIVTIDTAAAHLAGAIGHPRITLLLSHWSSWRWLLPLYENVRICQQDSPGDWEGAFAKRDG